MGFFCTPKSSLEIAWSARVTRSKLETHSSTDISVELTSLSASLIFCGPSVHRSPDLMGDRLMESTCTVIRVWLMESTCTVIGFWLMESTCTVRFAKRAFSQNLEQPHVMFCV